MENIARTCSLHISNTTPSKNLSIKRFLVDPFSRCICQQPSAARSSVIFSKTVFLLFPTTNPPCTKNSNALTSTHTNLADHSFLRASARSHMHGPTHTTLLQTRALNTSAHTSAYQLTLHQQHSAKSMHLTRSSNQEAHAVVDAQATAVAHVVKDHNVVASEAHAANNQKKQHQLPNKER